MQTYLFTGTITTRQPLAYSPPDHQDRARKSLLPRMTVPTAAGPMNTVFVSGSTIRGMVDHFVIPRIPFRPPTVEDDAKWNSLSRLGLAPAHVEGLIAGDRLVHEGGFDVKRLDDGAFRFTNPHGLTVRPPKRQGMSSPDTIIVQNDSLGLAIDCETATAHWHGERIDYDHALMVTMASWDSGDTRPEAGPVAGDWNPS